MIKKGKENIDDSIMCRFYCITFIEYMVARKTFLGYTNLFFSNDCKKNDKIIYKYFKNKYLSLEFRFKK